MGQILPVAVQGNERTYAQPLASLKHAPLPVMIGDMQDLFKDIAFSDPVQAESLLSDVLDGAPETLLPHLTAAWREAADPQAALVGIHRYLEAAPDADAERRRMAAEKDYARMVVTLFDQSHYLGEIVCRDPRIIPWLWETAQRTDARTREEMLVDFLADSGEPLPFAACQAHFRRRHQREMARIALRDVFDHAPVASITRDLANLADAACEAALRSTRTHLAPRYGTPRTERGEKAAFVVLGMGKLGGGELNYNSDIDLLFLFSENGRTDGERIVSNAEYFKRLGEGIIKLLSEQTAEGRVFRVDMRLRPFGASGPLAVSVDAALDYYTAYARAWERQALIKARPCAGDIALGETLLERLRPITFPRYFDDETLEGIREMKYQTDRQIAKRGERDRAVKQGRGGIRDIEFTVQVLQMLNGGAFEDLRTRNTLEAIEALGRRNLLSTFDATTLSSNYVFLRTIEHRLQIEGGQQRHTLPADAHKLDLLAKRLGYEDGAAFMRLYRDRANETRQILDQFLAAKGSGNLWVNELLDPRADAPEALAQLGRFGFDDPATARKELLDLAHGPGERAYPMNVRQQFAEIAPGLIRALGAAPDPDHTLRRLSGLLATMRAPTAVYQVLAMDPKLLEHLVTLAANSEYLTATLVKDPGLFDVLGSPESLEQPDTRASLEEELHFLENAYDADAALYRLRDGASLRVGLRELVCGISVAQVGDELTLLAEVILHRAYIDARRNLEHRFGMPEIPIAILGLGKLGGWEMGYGSDLDVVFVYDAEAKATNPSPQEYAAAVATKVLQRLTEYSAHGKLYDIDARLRPDGNKGVLAVSERRLHEYYRTDAHPWERMALMKVRAVAADTHFGARIERAAKDMAFSLPLNQATLDQIEDLRRRHTAQASARNLKHAEGGMSEVEFTARLWQLKHAAEFPELKRGDVFGAFDILLENDLVPSAPCEDLYEGYDRLRTILNRIRMMHGSNESELPKTAQARQELAARLGIDADLEEYVQEYRQRIHTVYEATRLSFRDRLRNI
ncbi:MAG: bifunctional [glutamate--ammonia ligase]-adenylyl-L-tyrosine phosphorylase/[glutamate--ammonia-ligase] adenylyltransferase [Candidatus Hydrogenedentota bacterium]